MEKKKTFWLKKRENWLPLSIFAGIIAAVVAVWTSVYFINYGYYFTDEYKQGILRKLDWNSGEFIEGFLSDIYVYNQTGEDLCKFAGADYDGQYFSYTECGQETRYAIYYIDKTTVKTWTDGKDDARMKGGVDLSSFAQSVFKTDIDFSKVDVSVSTDNILWDKKCNGLSAKLTFRQEEVHFSFPMAGKTFALKGAKASIRPSYDEKRDGKSDFLIEGEDEEHGLLRVLWWFR